MQIDCSKLERINPQRIQRYCGKDQTEYFFKVPISEMQDCAISTFGHLIRKKGDGWETPELTYRRVKAWKWDYCYGFTTANKKRFKIGLQDIIRQTFFPDAKEIVWHGEFRFHSKNVSMRNGKSVRNMPILDVTRFNVIFNVREDYIKYMKSIFDRAYQTPCHKLVNIPDLPPEPPKTKRLRPPYLEDGTPVKEIPGLSIELINSKYSWMRSRAMDEHYKNRKDKYRYKDTTISDDWLSRLNFQHWMNDNYYYYPELLELDKDIFGLCQANMYSADTCCFIPKYINTIFTTSKNDHPEKDFLGYTITPKTLKNGKKVYVVPTSKYERTGFYFKNKVCDDYISALNEGRKCRANKIRSVVAYEKKRKYIPDMILDQLSYIANLVEAGKFEAFEPDAATINKIMREDMAA